MTDPFGQNAYKGLGVPTHGESVIRQRQNTFTILTLMQSTANTGPLLMGIDHAGGVPASFEDGTSYLSHSAVFDIDEEGGYRAKSGTTIMMELNSSGLYAAGEKQIYTNTAGHAYSKKQTVDISSDGTSAYTLLSTNAGKMHMVSTGTYSSIVISLPTSETGLGIYPGMFWDIYSNTTAAGVIDITIIGANTGGLIHCHSGSTNAVSSTGALTHESSGPFWVRVMAVTTGGSLEYVLSNMMGRNGKSTNSHFGLSAGSTVLS